jgi:hypothetical protein
MGTLARVLAPFGALVLLSATPAPAAVAAGTYTTKTLHFAVAVGAGGAQHCDIVGDLYTPSDAGPAHRVPAILTTNGFGGSKDDQAGLGKYFASQDYAVLSYSGLGFGGSGCKITLDDPDADGQAARQLVGFLGGVDGVAYADAAHTQPVAGLDSVVHDATDHAGGHQADDPRVGMIGGSYGGEVQFAAASVDPRIDTLIPLITWNDLSYSLTPNNTDLTGVTSATPGVTKLTWPLLFFFEGALLDSVTGFQSDPSRVIGCPNFTTQVCPVLAESGLLGYPSGGGLTLLRHASVSNYLSRVRIPVLLGQGENDTLFNLNESIATYKALAAQNTSVKMIWQSWGHSGSTPAPGELDLGNPDPATQYETARVASWFGHYLKDGPADPYPAFTYFRDWVNYTGIATPAFGTANDYPAGGQRTFYLSGKSSLVTDPAGITSGRQSFLTPPGGLPTSASGIDAFAPNFPPDVNLPGTYAAWTSAPLTSDLHVVGTPTLNVRVQAPTAVLTGKLGPAGQLVLFAKVYDVAPDGSESLIHNLVAPVRIADPSDPVHITLPAIVHRFATGHEVRVMLAGGDLNHRGGLTPVAVTVPSGQSTQTLNLPTTD